MGACSTRCETFKRVIMRALNKLMLDRKKIKHEMMLESWKPEEGNQDSMNVVLASSYIGSLASDAQHCIDAFPSRANRILNLIKFVIFSLSDLGVEVDVTKIEADFNEKFPQQ